MTKKRTFSKALCQEFWTLVLVFSLFLFYLSTMAAPPSCGCLGLTGAFSSGRQGARLGLARNCVILWLMRVAYNQLFPTIPTTQKDSRIAPAI